MMTREIPKTSTLGDLIAAVTDEVSRKTQKTQRSANTNILVSYIVKDLFAKRRVRLLKGRRVLKIA